MICLFGGTFDPVHVGHVHAAVAVCDAVALPQIRMLLSARPGHRSVPGASIDHRWRMLTLACAADPRLVPDDTEVRRAERLGRPSYTVETLEELRRAWPREGLAWVVGSDAYREITGWHRWRDIFALANLVVLRRPGADLELPEELAVLTRERLVHHVPVSAAGSILMLDAPMLDVSATRVRKALADAEERPEIADLLIPAVYTYIKKYHLYGVVSDP